MGLLSVPPTLKYEADGGPGMADVLGLLKGTDDPATDQRTFLKVASNEASGDLLLGGMLTSVEAVGQARSEAGLQKSRRLAILSASVRELGEFCNVDSYLRPNGIMINGRLKTSRIAGFLSRDVLCVGKEQQ